MYFKLELIQMYSLVRSLLWRFPPETVHHLVLSLLRYIPASFFTSPPGMPVTAMGLTFKHPVGLAAGFDCNGVYLDALAKLGFSFIELGGVTAKPQPGNPQPRLFRLTEARALINRMGFFNQGVDALVMRIQQAQYQGILGVNIAKNKETSLENAIDDYVYCLQKVYPYASYVTVNVSSPNTPNLRLLQQVDFFQDLIGRLKKEQLHLAEKQGRYVPLVVKLSPDESDESLKRMADVLVTFSIDGAIATNTTVSRDHVLHMKHGTEVGGLSGAPLFRRSTDCLTLLKAVVGEQLTLIGVGGVDSVETAREKLQSGASLLQVYSGLVYQGPGLIPRILTGLS